MNVSVQRAAKQPEAVPASEFHKRLDELLPMIEAQANEAETLGYLTDDVVAAMRKAGIYTMLFPQAVGGAELSPFDAMTVIERLSYAHASVGWCVIGNNMEGTTMAIYIEDEGIKKVFAGGPDITIAGNGVPRGFARPVEGGYMIRGNWAYGSGIQHAEWVHSGCFLTDAAGKELWSVTLGKTPDAGNGKFIRFGNESRAFFSGTHVWLETDPKAWADSQLVGLKADNVAKVSLSLAGGSVELTRAKKDAPWTATGGPAGRELAQEMVGPVLTTLADLRFSDTLAKDDPAARAASAFAKSYALTTFDGRTIDISMGRKPEVKTLKAPVADTAPITTGADGKPETKPITPEFDTTPAGPVVAVVSNSDGHAGVNAMMAKRSFVVDDYAFTGLPQKADDLFLAAKAK